MNQDIEAHSSSPVVAPAENEIVVNSVAEFIDQLAQIDIKEGTETFYRGHANIEWKLLPSLLRTSNGADKEHLIFRNMVSHEPQSFSECRSTLDHLVHMQHYGLPTRLLDVTMNPLIALYFACQSALSDDQTSLDKARIAVSQMMRENSENSLGKLRSSLAFLKDKEEIDRILPILLAGVTAGAATSENYETQAGIALSLILREVDRDTARSIAKHLSPFVQAAARERAADGSVYLFSVPETKVKHYDSDTVSVLANLAKCEITEDCLALPSVKDFNEQASIGELIYQIRGEKPYFSPSVKVDDLNRILLVKPRNGNQRIINQMGAFLLFGLGLKQAKGNDGVGGGASLSKEVHLEVPNEWIKRKLIIPKGKKETIRKELANLGITDSYIYPGIEQYAKELKQRYKL